MFCHGKKYKICRYNIVQFFLFGGILVQKSIIFMTYYSRLKTIYYTVYCHLYIKYTSFHTQKKCDLGFLYFEKKKERDSMSRKNIACNLHNFSLK